MARGTWQTTDSSGGGGLVLIVVVAIVIGSGAASAVASAVVTVAIVIAVLGVAAVLGGVALVVYRARSERRSGVLTARPVYQLPPEPRPQLEETSNRAIEPPRELHVHLHGLTDEQIAAIVTRSHVYPEE